MKHMVDTNFTGLVNMTQAVLPIFQGRPNGGSGDIVNVGSIAGMSSQYAACHPWTWILDI